MQLRLLAYFCIKELIWSIVCLINQHLERERKKGVLRYIMTSLHFQKNGKTGQRDAGLLYFFLLCYSFYFHSSIQFWTEFNSFIQNFFHFNIHIFILISLSSHDLFFFVTLTTTLERWFAIATLLVKWDLPSPSCSTIVA